MSDVATNAWRECNGSEAAKSWFAVFTAPRHEKSIETHFRLRGIESFLPLYQTRRKWKDGSRGMLQLPLFSNYIFVRIACTGRVPVLRVPGVVSILGAGPQAWPVPDSDIDWLREGLRQGKIEPHPHLAVGRRVRICSGVMAGLEGVLLRNKNNLRVVVTLEMIMKNVTVEVQMNEIEAIDAHSMQSHPQVVGNA